MSQLHFNSEGPHTAKSLSAVGVSHSSTSTRQLKHEQFRTSCISRTCLHTTTPRYGRIPNRVVICIPSCLPPVHGERPERLAVLCALLLSAEPVARGITKQFAVPSSQNAANRARMTFDLVRSIETWGRDGMVVQTLRDGCVARSPAAQRSEFVPFGSSNIVIAWWHAFHVTVRPICDCDDSTS